MALGIKLRTINSHRLKAIGRERNRTRTDINGSATRYLRPFGHSFMCGYAPRLSLHSNLLATVERGQCCYVWKAGFEPAMLQPKGIYQFFYFHILKKPQPNVDPAKASS